MITKEITKRYTLVILAAALSFGACQELESPVMDEEDVLSAVIDQKEITKTVKDEENSILWSEGDQIVAFMKSSYGYKYQVKPSFVGKSYADFSRVSSSDNGDQSKAEELDHIVAYYPYSETVECTKSGEEYVLDVVLPSKQKYVANSFDNGAMAMVAVSEDRNITFKNVLGAMKLQFIGNALVYSIKVEGANGEKLSGAATIIGHCNNSSPTINMSAEASTEVVLDCGKGIQLNKEEATSFYIALPPVDFSKGLKVTLSTSFGDKKFETASPNTVYRSSILIIPELTWYGSGDYIDEYGINHGKGTAIGKVVWAPVNCGYHATDYPWGKLYQWGRKYGQGYSGYLHNEGGDEIGPISDATPPTIIEGSVSLEEGSSESNKDVFFFGEYDWLSLSDFSLWNSGLDNFPVKAEYDPCPKGWRVPTYNELSVLSNRYCWATNELDQYGIWFISSSSETESRVFFPSAGYRKFGDGHADYRGFSGLYWSSEYKDGSGDCSYCLDCLPYRVLYMQPYRRAMGASVRCVQE